MNKILIIILLIYVTSCANPSYTQQQETPKYEEIICPKCEGTGTVPQTTSQKIGFAIVTFGMTLMTDDEQRCPKCHGVGYVRIPILEEKYEQIFLPLCC